MTKQERCVGSNGFKRFFSERVNIKVIRYPQQSCTQHWKSFLSNVAYLKHFIAAHPVWHHWTWVHTPHIMKLSWLSIFCQLSRFTSTLSLGSALVQHLTNQLCVSDPVNRTIRLPALTDNATLFTSVLKIDTRTFGRRDTFQQIGTSFLQQSGHLHVLHYRSNKFLHFTHTFSGSVSRYLLMRNFYLGDWNMACRIYVGLRKSTWPCSCSGLHNRCIHFSFSWLLTVKLSFTVSMRK